MTRDEFLIRLRTLVGDLPPEEREDVMSYYTEYFDDAGPENEQQVIRQLGSPENVAREALGGGVRVARGEEGERPAPRRRGLGGLWTAVLALFAAPVALPLLFAGVLTAAAMCLVVLCLLAVPFIIAAAFMASGVVNVILSLAMGKLGFATVCYFFGAGLFMAAAGLLGLVFSLKLLLWGCRGAIDIVNRLLHRRRNLQ